MIHRLVILKQKETIHFLTVDICSMIVNSFKTRQPPERKTTPLLFLSQKWQGNFFTDVNLMKL